ncbi:UDP-N-acetylglucosamine 2-epimerase (non-hydrolyzing) [soil metagenome]
MTVLGTRPEIIRLSLIIPILDAHADHILLHTGQNFAPSLSDVFFRELGVRAPDISLHVRAETFAAQAAAILQQVDEQLVSVRPDKVLILGDTNSGLAAIVAARRQIPVYHLEAGNRCFDDRVPEEINRRLIDHSSAVLLPYTERSKDNLVREGIERERIFVVGNPIYEVLEHFRSETDASRAHEDLGVADNEYLLVTIHRAENVDDPARLDRLVRGVERASERTGLPSVWSVHPRTAERLRARDMRPSAGINFVDALGFFDFVHLEQHAACVITDSGTVQEECAIRRVPNVTVRDVTERPETLEVGSNVMAADDPDLLAGSIRLARELRRDWEPPDEYKVAHPSTAIAKIVLGYVSARRHLGLAERSNAPDV